MPATYENIATTTLGSASPSVTFSSISSAFTDLVVVCFARSDRTSDSFEALQMRLNSDTGTNYSQTTVGGDGSGAFSLRGSSASAMSPGRLSPSTGSYTSFDPIIIQLMNYANTTTNKTILARSNSINETQKVNATVGLWRSTSAINTILLYPALGANFVSGSTFTLYGIKAA